MKKKTKKGRKNPKAFSLKSEQLEHMTRRWSENRHAVVNALSEYVPTSLLKGKAKKLYTQASRAVQAYDDYLRKKARQQELKKSRVAQTLDTAREVGEKIAQG